jgi:hypothetical protein
MEIAFTYARELADNRALYLYVAPVGAPAIGPPAFMHRPSASILPIAPITHHWFDSTHITYGVVTFGYVASPRAKLEVSGFRGREPDQNRWAPEAPKLDSVSVRASVNPTSALSLQVSAGYLHDVEQLHPGSDVGRITASLMYSRAWRPLSIDALLAWGRNNRTPSQTRVTGGFLLFPGAVNNAELAEATVHFAMRHALVGRVEHADKDELFGLTDARHSIIFPITQFTAGYVVDVARATHLKAAVGIAASKTGMPASLRLTYGDSTTGVLGFVQFRTH